MNIFFMASLLTVVVAFFPLGILFALLARKFSQSGRSFRSFCWALFFVALALFFSFYLSSFALLDGYKAVALMLFLFLLALVPVILFYQKDWHLYEKLATSFWGALVFLVILFSIYNFSVTYPITINDDGMTPFFQKEDKVFCQANRNWGSYSRGDIVALENPGAKGKVAIRKVVATEGDRVESSEGKLLVNGQMVGQTEPNIIMPLRILGENEIFVLAEKKGAFDSRVFGPVKEDDIINKILFKVN